jgi:hypothetical protein
MYYTPKIEEFHVGFECEVSFGKGWYKGICKPEYVEYSEGAVGSLSLYYGDGQFINVIYPDCVSCKPEYRVKHLEESDLLELGWNENNVFTKDVGDLRYDYKFEVTLSSEIVYFAVNRRVYKKGVRYFSPPIPRTIYEGLCPKNKSELKKLMDMLKIN